METQYLEFFELLPKHSQLTLKMLVPHKYGNIDTELLACLFIQQGLLKKCVIENLKECADRIVENKLKVPKEKEKKLHEFSELELSEECEILIKNYIFFKSQYGNKLDQNIITAYISYIMIYDSRLKSSKLFDDIIYVKQKEKEKVQTELCNILDQCVNTNMSGDLLEFGEYLTDPLVVREHYDCFGREKEIQQCVDVLCRMRKNNVILVGNPGVGKTSVVYGFCNLIQSTSCPDMLKGYYVYELNINSMISGTTYRGDLEARIETVIASLQEYDKVIVFIDEIHNMFNKTGNSGSSSIAESFKTYLSKGSKIIGCTTESEYKQIESDKAFERRFTRIHVNELSVKDTISMLEYKRTDYEKFHNIEIPEEMCTYLVESCDTFIRNKYFPDKAFDIMDTSCVICRKNKLPKLTKETIDMGISSYIGVTINGNRKFQINEIEEEIKKNIIGQDEAVKTALLPIKRYLFGINETTRPIANLLLVGPTGTGKTELCKQLAKNFFTPESFLRYDMSEFMEPHSVSKLIGSPPGYIGYSQGGCITDKVKNNPFCIILLDEIEKAHKDVLNILLQVMDDGRLTDSTGETVDFRNTLIIMTSNIGCKDYLNKNSIGFENTNGTDIIQKEIKNYFTPEFLNRLDNIIYFNTIDENTAIKIFEKEMNLYLNHYNNKQITVTVSDNKKSELFKSCYSKQDGVRFIRKKIKQLLDPIILDKVSKSESNILVE